MKKVHEKNFSYNYFELEIVHFLDSESRKQNQNAFKRKRIFVRIRFGNAASEFVINLRFDSEILPNFNRTL
jgi:hypothetical protein